MDLRDGQITMEEILSDSRAKAIIKREFPQFAKPLYLRAAKGFTLREILSLASGNVQNDRLERVLRDLEALTNPP